MKDRVVYLHKRKDNGQVFYVGIGDSKRPYRISKSHRNSYWWNVFQKYGVEVEVINTGLSIDEACEVEKELIAAFGKRGEGQLVNLTDGGEYSDGYKHTPEMIEQFKITRQGKQNSLGRVLTDETKAKISLANRKQVIGNGIEYYSMTEASNVYDVSRKAIYNWVKDPKNAEWYYAD